MSDGLAKHDYLRDTTLVVEGTGPLTSPSEPVFVKRCSTRPSRGTTRADQMVGAGRDAMAGPAPR
jgi:hypothetical protein